MSQEITDRLRRRVLWSMPTGLYLVGSRAEVDGSMRRNLMTASLVVQVATSPKLVAAAIDTEAFTHRLMAQGGCFSLSMLDRADRTVVRHFVKPVPATQVVTDEAGRVAAMAGEPVFEAATGAPIASRAVGWLDCEVRQRLDLGSHSLFVGEVVAVGGELPEGSGVLRMEDTRMNYGGYQRVAEPHTVDLQTLSLTPQGDAVARDASGRAHFVVGALPGEHVRAEIVKRYKTHTRSRLVTLLEPSPYRQSAPCAEFDRGCGACQWQDVPITTQLELKETMVADTLARFGRFEPPPLLPTVVLDPWHHRTATCGPR